MITQRLFLPAVRHWSCQGVILATLGVCFTAAASGADRPVPLSRESPASKPAAGLADALAGLFEQGFVLGQKRLEAAEKHLAQARRDIGNDPRLDFAHGLVLLRQSQHKQAVEQFEAAVGRKGPAYWPAWQALIWSRLIDKQYEKGLSRMVEFARIVEQAEDPAEISEVQREVARWMGQVLEALDKTVDARKTREAIVQYDARLKQALGEELYDAVETGRDILREKDLDLAQEAGLASEALEKKQNQRKQSETATLTKRISGAEKIKEETAKSAEEWKNWLDDNLPKVDKQLGLLERDYKTLEQRGEALQQSIIRVGRELTLLESTPDLGIRTPGSNLTQHQEAIAQRHNDLANYQLEYNANSVRMMQVSQQGAQAMKQRSEIVARYEKATGQLIKKSEDLEKWTNRLNDKKHKLAAQPVKKPAHAAAGPKTRSFKTYVALDFELEKQRVLESFGIVAAEEHVSK